MHPIERLRFVARSQGAPAELLVEESAAALGAFRDDPAGLVAACRRIIDRQLSCGPLWWLCARLLCSHEPMSEARRAVTELRSDPTARILSEALPADATVVTVGWPEQCLGALERRGDVEVMAVDSDGESGHVVRQLNHVDVDAVAVPARSVGAAVAEAASRMPSAVVLIEALAVGPEQALIPAGSRAVAVTARSNGVPVWLVAGVGRLLPARMWQAMEQRWSEAVDPLDAAEETAALELVDRMAGPGGVTEVAEGLRRCDCPVAPELFRLAG